MVDPLSFQATEEAFSNRIIVAVALTAHAAGDAMIFENFLIIGQSALAASIRMVQQVFSGIETVKGHLQCIYGQPAGHRPGTSRPTNHLPVTQIQEHGQIQPATAVEMSVISPLVVCYTPY